MATGRIILPVPGGVAPDGSGTGNNPATPEKVVSSGTQTSNSPKASYVHLLFDSATDEHWVWAFMLPGDYASGGTLKYYWGAKVITGNVVWKGAAAIAVLSSTDLDAVAFDAVVTSGAVAVPGAIGHVKETSLALTMTNAGAARPIIVMAGRDADDATNDTAAGDATLVAAMFEYTTT